MAPRLALGASVMAIAAMFAAGCATSSPRSIDAISAHVDDASITGTVKSRLIEDRAVDATAITVETVNGNVALSGLARNNVEKSTAESIAIKVPGVKSIQNNIVVRP